LGIWFWVIFNLVILGLLALDLGVFHRREHEVKVPEALRWCAVWVSLALLFNAGVWHWLGRETALQFLTGYLIEYSLSIDNIFVFILIFTYFKVRPEYQHRVLFWGIIGALVLRASLILAGVALINTVHWIVYVFGAFLIISGIKFLTHESGEFEPERNPALVFARRYFPVIKGDFGKRFFVRHAGRIYATRLFVVLFVIEITDLIFALDSIPAILAISRDAFVVYTSNVFAILGLRSLYFALAGIMKLFSYLKTGLALVLVFVGLKMLLSGWFHIPIGVSLGVVAGLILLSILASLLLPRKTGGPAPANHGVFPASTIHEDDAV